MKKIIYLFLAIISLSACDKLSNKTVTITGTLGSDMPQNAEAYIESYFGDTVIIDTVKVERGTFSISKKYVEPFVAMIRVNYDLHHGHIHSHNLDNLKIFIDGNNVTLTSKDSLKNAEVKGSALYEEYQTWLSKIKPIKDFMAQKSAEYRKLSPTDQRSPETITRMQMLADSVLKAQQKVVLDYINSYPNSYISLYEAINAFDGEALGLPVSAIRVDSVFHLLSADIRNTSYGKFYIKEIEKKKNLEVGGTAPDFTMNNMNGIPVKLSSFRGKYVLLNFWISASQPSREMNTKLVTVYEKYKNRNFTIVSVSFDYDKAKWIAAIQEDRMMWTQLSNLIKNNSKVANLYNLKGVPDNLLLTPEGKIIEWRLMPETLDQKLNELLK